jgi:copper chaperone for superoxide dismutase
MVQVAPNLTLIDLTIRGLSPGSYWATVRETGDISNGAISTRGIWTDRKEGDRKPRGFLGTVQVGKDGIGSVFLDKPIQIWEMIGRGMVVSKQHEGQGKYEKNDEDTLVGVIARSAGVGTTTKQSARARGRLCGRRGRMR